MLHSQSKNCFFLFFLFCMLSFFVLNIHPNQPRTKHAYNLIVNRCNPTLNLVNPNPIATILAYQSDLSPNRILFIQFYHNLIHADPPYDWHTFSINENRMSLQYSTIAISIAKADRTYPLFSLCFICSAIADGFALL